MVFQEKKTESTTIERQDFSDSSKMVYDGQVRRVVQGGVANISEDSNDRIDAPHALILPHAMSANFHLSAYLVGGDALGGHPRFANLDTIASYQGEEMVDGLRCAKVLVESRKKKPLQAPASRKYLWLAHDRNELPVRIVCYELNYSADLPIEEARVTRFEEVSKGVWFPMAIHFTIYQELVLREGKSVIANTSDLVTKSVELDTKYPIDFFQKIEIPKGTSVYELKKGKVVKSYIQGGEGDIEAPKT